MTRSSRHAAVAVLTSILVTSGVGFARGADPATTPATQAATKPAPASRPSASARRAEAAATKAAIQTAVTDLTKEFQAALKSSNLTEGSDAALGRSQCDYFTEKPSDALSNDAILAALNRQYGADPLTAYVKWQLLSGLKDGTSEEETRELAAGLLKAYRTAPRPMQRPGVSRDQQQQLDKALRGKGQSDQAALREQLDAEVQRVARINGPVLVYRDELFRRLPASYETYAAGFEDAVARLQAGVDVREHAEKLTNNVRTWAAAGAPPQQVAAMSQAVAKLTKQRGPEYYDDVEWSAEDRKLAWRRTSRSLNEGKALDELIEYLNAQAADPNGGLKFKDNDKKKK
jgi:hypothetical protein